MNRETNNVVNTNPFKKFNTIFIISIILFLIIALVNLFFIKLYTNENNGMAGLWLFFSMIITGIPFLALIILSIINVMSIFKDKKNGVNIPTKIKILSIINVILVPIVILVYSLGSSFKQNENNNMMNEKLNELYGSSYEVLDKCSYSNTGGDYYIEYLLKLSNFDYPVVAHLDLNDNLYSDNYDELLKTKQLDYQQYIDNVFNEKTIALMNLYELDSTRSVNLKILTTKERLNDKNLLKQNIEQVVNEYINKFEDYNFNVSVYFTKQINMTEINNYYALLTENSGSCYEQFSKNINKSELEIVSVRIDEKTDVNEEIEKSVENIIDLSTRY